MIKVIAFDLVGVLVREKDLNLSVEEDKIERLFGPNISDADFLSKAKKVINDDKLAMALAKNVIDKIYEIRERNLLRELKKEYPNINIIIATNHISYIKEFIKRNFEEEYLDSLFISADLNRIKPNSDFYEVLLKDMKVKPEELLFLDDSLENIEGAIELGINTIHIEKNIIILETVLKYLKEQKN